MVSQETELFRLGGTVIAFLLLLYVVVVVVM